MACLGALALLAIGLAPSAAPAATAGFQRISQPPAALGGGDPNGGSDINDITPDGRYVAFDSAASNLLTAGQDTNGTFDIFVYDRQLDKMVRVSVASDGTQADGNSVWPAISSDGRYVAFSSDATNLGPGDTNGVQDVFVHDRDKDGNGIYDEAGAGKTATVRISVDLNGAQAVGTSRWPGVSNNGRYVVFESFANLTVDGSQFIGPGTGAFVYDRDRDGNGIYDETTPGSTGIERADVSDSGVPSDGQADFPVISANGQQVAFASTGTNLIDGSPMPDTTWRTYARDRVLHKTTLVSVASDGTPADAATQVLTGISSNGRYVTFESYADNLIGPGNDTNGLSDLFLHDRDTDANGVFDEPGKISTRRISINGCSCYRAAFSDDSRFVAYESFGNETATAVSIFTYNLANNTEERVTPADANGDSYYANLSGDGRYVTFFSYASNLLAPGTDNDSTYDVFLYDRQAASPAADLSVTKSDAPDPVHVGQRLTYTIVVRNNGPSAASNVTLQDQLPKNAGYGTPSTTQGTCTLKPEKRSLTCSLGAIASGGTVTVTIVIKPTIKGMITNTVSVSASSPPDPNTANNSATASTTVLP